LATDLRGKTFVVTGGTQGLGEGIARRVAELGAAGITICGRNADRGATVAKALEDAGCPALFVRADLAREEDCRNVIRRHDEHFRSLSGLVNAAATSARGTLEDTTVEHWDNMFALNTRAPFLLMQESVRIMKREGQGGSIVNILSCSAHGGQPYLVGYSTSKGALGTLTKNVANSLRGSKIRVNGLNIGWMATPNEHRVQKAMGEPDNWLEIADKSMPFGRILRPRDVSELVAYLFSDSSEMMTGSLIDFDQNVVGAYD
jgi:NAD(P)-dependent dehydrogenase (short-subunit alcohol dehydrogenase family)